VARSDTKTQENLLKSGRSREELDKAISSVHRWDTQRERLRGAVYMNLLRAGYIQATDLTNEYRKSGKLDDAKAKIRQEIRDAGWHAAEDSRIVTILIDSLSFLLIGQGLWDQAEELEVQALETRKRVLGLEHPDTLISMANLASTYRNQGRWDQAEELEIQALETRKRVLGLEHPDTLISMTNLASTYRNQGRWDQAEELEIQALETRKRVLGLEHPDTLISMANLASTYRNQGRWNQAEELGIQALETRKRVLGLEHPDTLISMANLASTYRNQGRWDQAEELEIQALETRKRVLGSEHPDTLTSVNNLALILRAQGKYVEAETLNRRVLEERKRVMGELHPDTLTSVRNLALVLQDQEKYDEAEKMYQRALEGREKQLGKEHPDTLHSIHCLALLLHQLKRYEMASELYQRACDGFRKTLGPDHPKTVACLNNYSAMQIEKSPLKSVADEQVNSAPTDSGYASMAHGKSVPVFDTSQIGIDVIAKGLSLPDTNPAVEFEHSIDQEQVIPKFGLYTAPTTYSASETSTLPLPRDEKYISQLALDLFSSVKSYESDRTTLERISGKLPDLLRAFALKIGHKAQNPMHQDVSFFVHKHRR